jgi:hypothetical protein
VFKIIKHVDKNIGWLSFFSAWPLINYHTVHYWPLRRIIRLRDRPLSLNTRTNYLNKLTGIAQSIMV